MKIFLLFCLAGFLMVGCGAQQGTTVPTADIPSHAAGTATEVTRLPLPSPTDIQLPYNLDAGSQEYCQPPYAVLPVEDGNDISEDEIVYELVRIWLRRYKQSSAPGPCRIADYSIEKVYDDPAIYSKVLEPRGDFKRVVVFSVKLVQVPSDWISFAGKLDRENWLHISHIVAITRTSEGYTLEFANP